VIWKGPLREDDRDQQIQVVENFTGRQVSGIVLAPLDSQALVNPVASAVQAGIPVIVMDSGL
jgi:ribose transport system substrate-binding protein